MDSAALYYIVAPLTQSLDLQYLEISDYYDSDMESTQAPPPQKKRNSLGILKSHTMAERFLYYIFYP